MNYKGYTIERGKPVTTPKGSHKGVIDVKDASGQVVNFFTYTLRNHLSLQYAKSQAKKWVNSQIKK